MMYPLALFLALISALVVAACAPGGPRPAAKEAASPAGVATGPSRTLVIAVRGEPSSLSPKPLQRAQLIPGTPVRLFNATLTITAVEGEREVPRPYLADATPQVHTEDWLVFPDGRMATTYRLKPNLRWHDGVPLTAEDFAFAWRAYATPELGVSTTVPLTYMEDAVAADTRTLVIRWQRLYPDAGTLSTALPALPRHVLEGPFQRGEWEAFTAHPYWTTEYIGLGPYQLDRWEPGAFIEGLAFDGHVWGRPKIDRVRVLFISDFNTVLANLLAGEVDMTIDQSIRFEQGLILRREWAASKAGTVISAPSTWRKTHVQLQPELANPRAILDVRVRKALMHAIDRESLNDALFQGEAIVSHSMILPGANYHAALDRAIVKYPYDLGRTEQLMREAGFIRGADGFYASPTEGRFSPELLVLASPHNENEKAVIASGWRQAGIDVQEATLPVPLANTQEATRFRALYTYGGSSGEKILDDFRAAVIPRAETRWKGNNRSSWVDPEFERLYAVFNSTLDRSERDQQAIQLAKITTEELPVLPLYFNPSFVAYTAGLQGIQATTLITSIQWNIHEWEWRS